MRKMAVGGVLITLSDLQSFKVSLALRSNSLLALVWRIKPDVENLAMGKQPYSSQYRSAHFTGSHTGCEEAPRLPPEQPPLTSFTSVKQIVLLH